MNDFTCPTCEQEITKKHHHVLETKKMQYGVVIILDSLGTKGIWRDQDLDKVILKWELLLKDLDNIIEIRHQTEKFDCKYNAFSDTIIMTFVGNTIEKLLEVASYVTGTLIASGIMNGVYLRGSISVGNFTHKEQLILGPAVDEAAEFFEKDNWIGASATPSAYSVLKRLIEEMNTDKIFSFVKYNIPRHNGIEKEGFALLILWDFVTKGSFEKELRGKNMIELAHHHLEKSSNPTGADKWKNLLDFMYFLKSRDVNQMDKK